MAGELESDIERLEEELKAALVERDPADSKDVIVEIRQGVGRGRGGAVGGRRLPDAHALRRAPRLQDRDPLRERERDRRLQGGRVRGQGRRRVLGLQVRGRDTSRPARARDGVAGAHPHVDGDRCRDARSRGGRSRDRGERSARSTSTARPAPAARASTRPTRRCASPTCRRESSLRCRTRSPSSRTGRRRCASSAPGSTSSSARRSRRGSPRPRKSQIGTGERAEKIRTYNFAENRLTDHRIKLTVHRLDQILDGDLEEFTEAIQAEDRRLSLEAAGV